MLRYFLCGWTINKHSRQEAASFLVLSTMDNWSGSASDHVTVEVWSGGGAGGAGPSAPAARDHVPAAGEMSNRIQRVQQSPVGSPSVAVSCQHESSQDEVASGGVRVLESDGGSVRNGEDQNGRTGDHHHRLHTDVGSSSSAVIVNNEEENDTEVEDECHETTSLVVKGTGGGGIRALLVAGDRGSGSVATSDWGATPDQDQQDATSGHGQQNQTSSLLNVLSSSADVCRYCSTS